MLTFLIPGLVLLLALLGSLGLALPPSPRRSRDSRPDREGRAP
jgi:hypothetical protein